MQCRLHIAVSAYKNVVLMYSILIGPYDITCNISHSWHSSNKGQGILSVVYVCV